MTDLVWHLFDGFDPEERPEPPAPVVERDKEVEEIEDVAGNSKRPKCRTCGGPNFSLKKDVCIACRALFPAARP